MSAIPILGREREIMEFEGLDASNLYINNSTAFTFRLSFLKGLELTFFSGVYGTCIGAVNKFGSDEKSLIGLSGIFIGIGEILGESKEVKE